MSQEEEKKEVVENANQEQPEEKKQYTSDEIEEIIASEEPKPGETIVEETPVEKVEEKTEQQETTEAFFQTEYQDAMGQLKGLSPDMHNQIMANLKSKRTDRQPEVQSKPTETADEFADEQTVLLKKMEQMFDSKLGQMEEKQQLNSRVDSFNQEFTKSNKILEEFVAKGKITPEQLTKAYGEVKGLNPNMFDINKVQQDVINGAPSMITQLIIKELRSQALQDNFRTQVTQAGAEAADKANAIKQVAQPSSGAMPTPKEKTRNTQILEVLDQAKHPGDANVREEMFSFKKK